MTDTYGPDKNTAVLKRRPEVLAAWLARRGWRHMATMMLYAKSMAKERAEVAGG